MRFSAHGNKGYYFMRKLDEEVLYFLQQKLYVVLTAVTAVGSYGFAITHEGIGVDDTLVGLYLEDGLEPFMGRWTVYLVNKLFRMGEFVPFITELGGALLLFVATLLFCVLIRRIFGDQVDISGYTAFACAFISCPFISEVWVYYFHDGVDIGYVLIALSLLLFMDGLDRWGKAGWRYFTGSMLALWAAVGCYESFVVFYLMGVLLILFFRGVAGREKPARGIIPKVLLSGGLVLCCMLLRNLMQKAVTAVFALQDLEEIAVSREVSDGLKMLGGGEWLSNLFMTLKRYWLVYFVNGAVYFPITVYVLAALVLGIASIFYAIKKKNGWYPVLFLGIMIVPVFLVFLVTAMSWYRICQYMPFFVASAVLMLYLLCRNYGKRYGRGIFAVLAACLVWNQAYEMNRSFYTDYRKYIHSKDVLASIAGEVGTWYDRDAQVIFTGDYQVPYELVKDYYAGYASDEFRRIAWLTDWLDPHLKEKYYGTYGYYYGGEARFSLIEWGMYAFGRPGEELKRFLRMHGYDLRVISEPKLVRKAEEFARNLPRWPADGAVVEMDGYVVVHF